MYTSAQRKHWSESTKKFLQIARIEDKFQYTELQNVLRFHEWLYYVQNDPIISDVEYDNLYLLLTTAESQNPSWITADSPSQRVSNDLIDEFKSVEHLTPMLSLDNTYNLEDLKDFDNRVKKLCNLKEEEPVEYLVEPKFDGGSLAVIFENDLLIRAATRGDGVRGEEMTNNAKTIRSLPLTAKFSEHGMYKVELRGEALIRKDIFEQLNEQREEDGLARLANPRNAATGVLRVKDPKETASRNLDLFIFQFGYAVDKNNQDKIHEYKTQDELIELVSSLGFKVANIERKECKNIEAVYEHIQTWAEKRDQYHYELDGMVIKVNDLRLQEKCGYTSHHPRWAVAFKFQAKQANSILEDVEYQVGKIGSITPVAKIKPVALAGVTVSSISLHNEDFIQSRDLHYGDTVLVERAGDVIPYIVKAIPEFRPAQAKPIIFPTACPVCKTSLIREEDEAAWRCPNINCEAQRVQRLIHHVSKDAMDIDGLGSSLVERFYQLGMIKEMADIYNLDYEAIAQLEGMGTKSAQKLKKSIDKAKTNPIHRLIHGLCVHHVGKKVSKLIAAHIEHVMDLQHWTLENYTAIKDVGPVVGNNLIAYFSEEKNILMLRQMEGYGVNFTQTTEDKPKQISSNAVLSGKTILFTGTLKNIGRKEAQELAENHGAKNLSAVSSNLNILVVGEDSGSKLTKAKALGSVEIWTEEEFLQILGKI